MIFPGFVQIGTETRSGIRFENRTGRSIESKTRIRIENEAQIETENGTEVKIKYGTEMKITNRRQIQGVIGVMIPPGLRSCFTITIELEPVLTEPRMRDPH
ncbi:hypothetical protein EVAR_86008_1 [Eumeta japonica]|uniref:Uncharacterized protein n=1 Tax=Eumeta variegata TaxID=151549 RepID=A0A4C1UKK4_EUMVA|nr:hypothetical protein EVAR_86008_1 [Eumeta japonica]